MYSIHSCKFNFNNNNNVNISSNVFFWLKLSYIRGEHKHNRFKFEVRRLFLAVVFLGVVVDHTKMRLFVPEKIYCADLSQTRHEVPLYQFCGTVHADCEGTIRREETGGGGGVIRSQTSTNNSEKKLKRAK